jgi:hypothetical protein
MHEGWGGAMNGPDRPPKPRYQPFVGLPRIPAMAELWSHKQWVAWDYVWKSERQKYDKPPINALTGRLASHSDPTTWCSYEEARQYAQEGQLPGVGFVLSDDDDMTGFDFDGCRDPETRVLEPWVAEIVALAETYTEVSPSGAGIRMFARGKIAAGIICHLAKVEVYRKQRYLTVTGRHVNGTPLEILPAPRTIALLQQRVEAIKQGAQQKATRDNPEHTAGAAAGAGQQAHRGGKIWEALRDPFFAKVNEEALKHLSAWVPALFGSDAVFYPGTGGYRVSSAALGRDLEEDLSITPMGIKDFGVFDMGDPSGGRRSAVRIVMDYGGKSAAEAALWLCQQLGIDPRSIGWRSGYSQDGQTSGAGHSSEFSEKAEDDQSSRSQDSSASEGAQQHPLPIIRIVPGDLPRIVNQAEDALIASNVPVFVRSGELVRPVTDVLPAAKGRTAVVARLRPMCKDTMLDVFGQAAIFERFDGRKKQWVRCDPDAQIASLLLAREGAWRLPRISGVITTPTLRPDGTLLSTPGYDAATRLYLATNETFELPEKPSHADAQEALALLLDLITEFPFVGPVDRAVAMSGIITAVVRGAFSVAPLHAIRAHTPGTGKSLLVDLASAIATGRPCPVIAPGKKEDETEKRLGALLRAAVPIVSLDNVNGELGGDTLCQITERPFVRVRILGLSEVPEFECRSTVFATGNNLVLVGDMVRRTLLCSLDAGVERPELRSFKHEPIDRVLRNRAAYIAAALTIPMAYRAAGSPAVCPALGSYGDWSQTVRAPLIWLGQDDPVKSMETARHEDPELTAIRELIGHWQAELSLNSPYTTNRIIQVACQKDPHTYEFTKAEFRDLLLRLAGEGGAVNSRRLGRWLSRISGRIVAGFRLHVKQDSSHGNQFSLRVDQPGRAR